MSRYLNTATLYLYLLFLFIGSADYASKRHLSYQFKVFRYIKISFTRASITGL